MEDIVRKYYEATKVLESFDFPAGFEPPVSWTATFYKEYPRLDRVKLPVPETGSIEDFESILKKRSSVRELNGPVRLNNIAYVMTNGLGIDQERRPYPSAGARYPVETYLVAFDIDGLDKGAYHYNLKENSLECLLKRDLSGMSEDFMTKQNAGAPAQLLFTSVLSRSEVKYGANAYRFGLLEAGHMAQNVLLLATKRGLGACPIGGFVNDKVSEVLDLTPDEIPIYSVILGNPKV